nr:odv-e43 [Darna trima granulovirus]
MTCSNKIKVYISDEYIYFPYNNLEPQLDAGGAEITNRLTVFVSTYADEKAVLKSRLTRYQEVRVIKYVSSFVEDKSVQEGVVVYWNAIVPIKTTGVGNTLVFNVVLSDNLYACHEIHIDNTMKTIYCPLQTDYKKDMVCLKGELAGDTEELKKARSNDNTNFIIHFDKETPLGIKILNSKRFLIALSAFRQSRATVCIYLSYDELITLHKELSWESTRRQIRGGTANACTIVNRLSYRYIVDALEILGIDNKDIMSLHKLVEIFNPLIAQYNLVPDIFVELNRFSGEEKHVRLYCKHEAVAITNAGLVPLNMNTTNSNPFTHKPLTPLPESFYKELNTRNVFVHAPSYNYFL